ncbi:DUF1700 domain-containing protein [Heyndrickxia oleronia]|uniref:DUF1700 domain-containing protein n=1 Tax=Heyndrickxia oleronia TaxID=38875 RepID=UPI001C0F1673|nr:DUF1700 domain-containing protein [Heyndrickxia oleronia]MBU5214830.1 DUF1700 domain-containing protein [Heyndrickxia oleronia]
MNIKLNMAEQQFLNEVLEELKQYNISSKDRSNIKQQLLEHIQESRELGKDSIKELGNSHELVKDFLEINGIDLHSEIKQIRKSKSRTGILFVIGFFTLILSYLGSQLIFSMFLTESFNSQGTSNRFYYNIFFQISNNPWWNSLLMIISMSIACLVSVLVIKLFLRKIIIR